MGARRAMNPGPVRCLGLNCDKVFLSIDKATNRLCATCTRKISKERSERVLKSNVKPETHT